MKKLALLAFALASFAVSTVHAQKPWDKLTAGWDQQRLQYSIQHPWNLDEGDRFKREVIGKDTYYHFEIRKNDASHGKGNKTQPRTEMKVNGLDYRTKGKHQFEADFSVAPGTTGVIIFQIKQDGGSPVNVYMTLRIIGNNLCFGEKPIMPITKSKDKWYHLNVIHNAATGPFEVHVDGKLIHQERKNSANSNYDHFFKCGTYNMSKGAASVNKVTYRNIKIWRD